MVRPDGECPRVWQGVQAHLAPFLLALMVLLARLGIEKFIFVFC
jgi:hypothetical protein